MRYTTNIIYLLTILSGAAALIYEIVWFRSLSLIFGGTHLAIATTVSVFMFGMALGSWLAGRYLRRFKNILRVYAGLELGIGAGAGLFMLLVGFYPAIYASLAQVAPESPLYLTIVRIGFSVAAMSISTIFMGATLPVLTKFLSANVRGLARQLSLLYGLNTLGAAAGVIVTGFYLLRVMTVDSVSFLAMMLNAGIGVTCLVLSYLAFARAEIDPVAPEGVRHPTQKRSRKKEADAPTIEPRYYKFVLSGIGLSGFCALGYEMLWTRVLIIFLDASVYSFSIVLVAFLLGISLGGFAYRGWRRVFRIRGGKELERAGQDLSHFGMVQILIGLTSMITISAIYDLPARLVSATRYFYEMTGVLFTARQFSNFTVAFVLMFVPAFLMGIAVPLAGRIGSRFRSRSDQAVGEILAFNTVGSILGAALSGFLLIELLGIQHTLVFFTAMNITTGSIIILSNQQERPRLSLLAKATLAGLLVLVFFASPLESWDRRYLASYTPNNGALYQTPDAIDRMLEKKEVLYYGEGTESIVSSVRAKSTGLISFTVNGRVEASTQLEDVQLQYLLGHLPMLFHPAPKTALVVGAGSGMTLGAVSVHPGLEKVTLAEIEPKVLGVLKSFSDWNHNVLENPKLDIVFNDGRNFLLTTDRKFDVITTDPIHPSWRGSGYLYTTEYFKLVADHLAPGGIVSQWLPLYQLSVENQRSIVKTFHKNFAHVTVFIGLTDMVLVGSNDPLLFDAKQLAVRIQDRSIHDDLQLLRIDTPRDLFSYFLMGTKGVETFGSQARINSDNNLYLEFSSPRVIGNDSLMAKNVDVMTDLRETILPYLVPLPDATSQAAREKFWNDYTEQAREIDTAQVFYLRNSLASSGQRQDIRETVFDSETLSRGQNLKLVLFGTN